MNRLWLIVPEFPEFAYAVRPFARGRRQPDVALGNAGQYGVRPKRRR